MALIKKVYIRCVDPQIPVGSWKVGKCNRASFACCWHGQCPICYHGLNLPICRSSNLLELKLLSRIKLLQSCVSFQRYVVENKGLLSFILALANIWKFQASLLPAARDSRKRQEELAYCSERGITPEVTLANRGF
jgi:hypothetical protein